MDLKLKRATIDWDDGGDTTSVGVCFRNCNFIRDSVYLQNFCVGVQHYGDDDGSSYSITDMRENTDCKIGLQFKIAGVGWANQHEIHGRVRLSSSSLSGIAGTRYIDMSTSGNGSTFVGVSLEGNRNEYCVDCSVPYITFDNCRFEQASPIRLNTNAFVWFLGGYGVEGIGSTAAVEIIDNGGHALILGRFSGEFRVDGGAFGSGMGYVFKAFNSASNKVLTFKDTTDKIRSETAADGTVSIYRVAKGDASFPAPAIILDAVNRKIWLGDGTATPVQWIIATSQTRVDVQATVFRTLAELEIDGALNHDGTTIGEYGATPTAQTTGWGAPTGTATKTTFDTTTVTLPQLAERVKAMIDYFKLRGTFGA
jgi:hypothetical protein